MTKALLAFTQDAAMRDAIDTAAARLDYRVEHGEALPANAVDFLVARQPWLIVIDLTDAQKDWQPFVLAAKTSPATRKLPILAIVPELDADLILSAKKAGCNAVMSGAVFAADAAGAIQQYSRIDESEALLRQSQQPLPDLAKHAIEQFNQREFWEQHETFELVWKAEQGPVRQMYQGILQVGVAYLQIQRRNYAGARKLFQRAWQYLNVLPDVCQGVDIGQLKADAQIALAKLETLGQERIAEFPDELFKPVRFATPA